MKRQAIAEKVFVVGLDAMDPRLTRKYVDMGIMPNVQKLIEKGSARHDLVLLGAMPTVTPPQWTTLATGAYPQTHDCTAFFRQGDDIDKITLNFDSRNCKAEQLWNVTAEAGFKTLVWHWPGSAWPPSSDSPNLIVVDGTSPGSVNMSSAQFESEFLAIASPKTDHVVFRTGASSTSEVPCVVTGLGDDDEPAVKNATAGGLASLTSGSSHAPSWSSYILDPLKDGQGDYINIPINASLSPLTDVDDKWAQAPKDAKEFVMLLSSGLIRRPCLVLKNDQGKYDTVAIYKNKKSTEPIAVLKVGEYVRDVVDEGIKHDQSILCNRDMRMLQCAEDGSYVKIWVSAPMDINMDKMWHPKSLHKEIVNNIGFPPPTSTLGGGSKEFITDCMHACWEHTLDWQADALNYMIEKNGVEVIFSHFHAPDLQKHMFIREMVDARPEQGTTPEDYQKFMMDVYTQIDRYIGRFLHLLDKDWTLIVTSDHAQVCPTYGLRGFGDTGCNISIMEELGFTTMLRDQNGELILNKAGKPQIDWTKTIAVANREMMIYLNIKGRNKHTLPDGTVIDGLVDPADQFKVEEEIMTALYGYKDKVTGQRIIAFALRRQDAVLVGLGGNTEQCGDITYCMAQGYEHDHDDSMPTSHGECDTYAGPVFIAAGKGIKEGFETERCIRQVDVAPTIAMLLGTRFPAQCEGAPVYQIFSEQV